MNQDDQPQDGLNQYETEPGSDQKPDDASESAQIPPASGYVKPIAPEPTTVFCIQCGYNLTSIPIGSTCPECGRAVAPAFHGQVLPTSGKSIASLVLGICSIPSCVLYGVPAIVCGILAIVFARKAKAQLKAGQAGGSTQSMATAGLICGIIGLCLGLIYFLGIAAFIGLAIYSSP
jgi:hypothetical protein